MNITFVQCHSWGPAGYRCQFPARLLEARGHQVRVMSADRQQAWSPSWFVGDDVVVIQRQHDVRWLEMLRMVPHLAVVCEFDDLLWALKGNELPVETKRGFMQMVRRCDGVTVSTPELARKVDLIRGWGSAVACIPNGIDFGLRDWENRPTFPRPAGNSVVIGWAGSLRGDDDFQVMGDALARVLADHPEAIFAIGGDLEENAKHCGALGLPEKQVSLLPAGTFETYPQLIGHFDVGLAPLSVHPANACKSELKLMEYGALGIPYVASEIAPYRRFHDRTARGGGYLCQTPTQWRLALEALVSDLERRAVMGQWLRAKVQERYSLEDTAERWEAALSAAHLSRAIRPGTELALGANP